MTKFIIPAVAAAALLLAAPAAPEAKAQGIHFRAGGLHIDVGNPHGRYYANYGRSYRSSYRTRMGHGDFGYGRGHRVARWHDTSHFDYIPGHYVPHGNHFDYVPGRVVWHRDGHWDIGHRRHRHHH